MGLFSFGGSKSKSSSNSSSKTYVDGSQQPYLNDIRGQAQTLNAEGMPVAGVAGINPTLSGAINAGNMSGGMQVGAGTNLMALGASQTGGTNAAMNYANTAMGGTAANGINTAVNTGNTMAANTGMANAAVNNGFNQGNVDSAMTAAMPGLQNMINASTRDITRDLNENQLTAISSQASGSGNSGSSRAGIMEGIATRGALDRSADVGASILNNANNMYTNMEANRASQNAGYRQGTNLANASAYNANLGLGANVGTNAYNANIANNQFGANLANQIGVQGVNNMSTGANMANTGVNMAMNSGNILRDYDQDLLNYDYNVGMAPYNSLNFYNNIVGAPNNLSSAESSSKGKSNSFNAGFG
jgi:hypothetical protein